MVRNQSSQISMNLAKQITYPVQGDTGKAWKNWNSDIYAKPNVTICSILSSCINFEWYTSSLGLMLSKLIHFPVCLFAVYPIIWLIIDMKIINLRYWLITANHPHVIRLFLKTLKQGTSMIILSIINLTLKKKTKKKQNVFLTIHL